MINLLPPDIKEQIHYSKRNGATINYLIILTLGFIISGGLIGYSYLSLDKSLSKAKLDLASKQAKVAEFKDLEANAKQVNARISAIKSISAGQSRFSSILDDLARYTPKSVIISSITLTGDDKKPVRIVATGDSYASIASLRDALATVPRISGVDIENITYSENDKIYNSSVVIGFLPGKAK